MTPDVQEALQVGRALGYLEAALDLMTLFGVGLMGLGLWSVWRWRQARWRG